MTQFKTTNSGTKITNFLKWVLSILFFLFALFALTDKALISSLFFIIAGLIISPPIRKILSAKLPITNNKIVRITLSILMLVLGFATSKHASNSKNLSQHNIPSSVQIEKSQYQNYFDETRRNIAHLSSERKMMREKLYSELKDNLVYKNIVEKKTVSTEYLPSLNLIANGIMNSKAEQFAIDETLVKRLEATENGSSKLRFVTLIVSLSLPMNGGMPEEIIEVFERYKTTYKVYNDKGLAVTADGKRETIEYAFDFTPFFLIIDPKNPDILDQFYEAKQKGFSSWPNSEISLYPYLNSKKEYNDYLKGVNPQSPYVSNVDLEISAYDLFAAYDANEVLADEQYKGKKLAISGIISTIGKDVLNDPYVSIRVDYLESVNCYFSKENVGVLSRLLKGQKVTIIGTCRGFIIRSVVIKDCEMN